MVLVEQVLLEKHLFCSLLGSSWVDVDCLIGNAVYELKLFSLFCALYQNAILAAESFITSYCEL